MNKKIISIIGARPQFIKAAPLSIQLRKAFTEKIIHTGQHYDFQMSDVFFKQLEIPIPDYSLNIGSYSHGKQTGLMLIEIEKILLDEKPDIVIVFGDTNTTLAGALAASKLHICVAHVEAGLRSFNKIMPEETNRVLTDHISNILFIPSENARINLASEGIKDNVYNVGDIMYDSIKLFSEQLYHSNVLHKLSLLPKKYYVATLHRPENVDNKKKLTILIEALGELNNKVVIPLHPRTKARLEEYSIKPNENTIIIEPLSYIDMINLVKNSLIVLTDSGGLQKDAYYLEVPCITLREETEWIETIESGWNMVVGTNKLDIYNSVNKFSYKPPSNRVELYGQGSSSVLIAEIVTKYFKSEA